MEKKQAVIVFCAHSDDQIFGPGGTMAKYAQKGIEVINVIFSYGELSHPWLKRRIAAETRENEAKEADKVIGGKEVLFLGVDESKFEAQVKEAWVLRKIEEMIKNYKPIKIFTHSQDDVHPAHRAVYMTVMSAINNTKHKCDTYTFDIWNPFSLKGRELPKMYVDITDTFNLKIKALGCFKSQWIAMIVLLWSVYVRALLIGFDAHCKYAERFSKVR